MNPNNLSHSLTTPLALPPRLRESSFRRYEPVIAQIVSAFPMAVKINHGAASPVTFTARLRDAMKSLYDHHWATSSIDIAKFRYNYLDLRISHRENGVFAGSKIGLEAMTAVTHDVFDTNPSIEKLPAFSHRIDEEVSSLELNNLTRDEVKLLCLLSAQRAFVRPIEITAEWLSSEEEVNALLGAFDIALDRVEDKVNTYLLT